MKIPSLNGINVSGKRVLVRADLNVPMKDGKIADSTRIDRFLPTLCSLIRRNAAVIVASHMGRPEGHDHKDYTLEPVARNMNIELIPDCAQETKIAPGDACLLENLRFYPEEQQNNPDFAKMLAGHADIYVNDAFACSHRAHASNHAITDFLPSFAGPALIDELNTLERTLSNLERPCMAIVAGNKIYSKIHTLENLVRKVDLLVIGGGMANTFLAVGERGFNLSHCEFDAIEVAKGVLELADHTGCEILLPEDVVTAYSPEYVSSPVSDLTVTPQELPRGQRVFDIGKKSVDTIIQRMESSKSLIWNGPLGMYENPPFEQGTFAVAREAADLCKQGKLTVLAGGGDTIATFRLTDTFHDFSYVSMGGGAFLTWLQQKPLPAVEVLISKRNERLSKRD